MKFNTHSSPSKAYFKASERILKQLNAGAIESASISEAMLVETPELLNRLCPESYAYVQNLFDHGDSIYKFYEIAALGLLTTHGADGYQDWIYHHSDTVRCWVAYWIAHNTGLGFAEQLKQIEPLACDHHFWVRENACMAIRPLLLDNLKGALTVLEKWANSDNPHLRHFTLEITRPKGFWAIPIKTLQQHPEKARSIIEPMRNDPDRSVQEALANWLIEAEDLKPGWSKAILDDWLRNTYDKESNKLYKKVMASHSNTKIIN